MAGALQRGLQAEGFAVDIAGGHLSQVLEVYFQNSEQLPTRLWLHADAQGASGMLLQKLPPGSAKASAAPRQASSSAGSALSAATNAVPASA